MTMRMSVRHMLWNREGHIAIGVGLSLVPLMLGVGLAVDVANTDSVRSKTQSALDAAAMEIALNAYSGRSDAELRSLGQDFMIANLRLDARTAQQDDELLPMLHYLGLSTDASGKTHLDVRANRNYDYLIPRGLGGSDAAARGTIAVHSRISAAEGDPACIFALNPSASRALQAGGGTSVDLNGCIIASNSSAADALYVGGSAEVKVDCAQATGGIDAGSGLVTDCERNRTGVWPASDPFKDLVEPMPPMLRSNPNNNVTTISPGRYRNLSLNGTKHLEPGLYYIEGKLDIKGDITGTGVTFFLKDGGVDVNGNASLSLSAPTSGDHAGMLFWSAQSNTSSHRFNGNGSTDLDGFLYFPDGFIDYAGNSTLQATCLRIVADRVRMTGNSKIASDCSAELGGREARVTGALYYSR